VLCYIRTPLGPLLPFRVRTLRRHTIPYHHTILPPSVVPGKRSLHKLETIGYRVSSGALPSLDWIPSSTVRSHKCSQPRVLEDFWEEQEQEERAGALTRRQRRQPSSVAAAIRQGPSSLHLAWRRRSSLARPGPLPATPPPISSARPLTQEDDPCQARQPAKMLQRQPQHPSPAPSPPHRTSLASSPRLSCPGYPGQT